MAIIGNIFIVISSFLYFALVSSLYGKVPPRGGDAAMGYVWGIIFLNLAFLVCMTISTISVAWKGGFEWISANKSTRYTVVVLGLLAATIGSALCCLFKYENGPVPAMLRFFSSFAPAVIPLVLIISGIILLNNGIRNFVPVAIYKWPLIVAAFIGFLSIISAIGGFAAESARNRDAVQAQEIKDVDDNQQRMLREIDSCDVTKNMVFILVFTDANQSEEVRTRAVAKVKTNPGWQSEIVRLLQTEWVPEAFNFLASNPVDSTEIFLEPLKKGIEIQASLIRQSIQKSSHESHFYSGQFKWEIERVIRTVDIFKGKGVDYLPAMKKLRAALDERSEYKKITFDCVALLDKWISAQK